MAKHLQRRVVRVPLWSITYEAALRNVADRPLTATRGAGWMDGPQDADLHQKNWVAKARAFASAR